MARDAALRRAGAAFLTWLPVGARDAIGAGGLVSVAFGFWLLAPAAGFIVGGLEAVAVCALLTASPGAK
jgi:hypothetical protein